jgi:membrane fusion protein, multidrug efflux system
LPAEPHQSPEHQHVGLDHQLPSPPASPRRSGTVRVLVWIVLLLIFAVAFWLVWHHKDTTKAAGSRRGPGGGPVTITTATAQRGNLGVYLDAIGTVTPLYTSSITAQVTGVIQAVHYKEGQFVRKGDPLIDIDARPYEASLVQAQGALERDQNLLAEAEMDLKRYQDAWARNAIPRQTLEDQEKLVLQDQGTVKNDQGLVQFDEVQVAYCHITSPITGRVGLRLVDPGNMVVANATTPLVVVAQTQPITVVFTIPEDSLPPIQARLRQGATLPLDAYDRTGDQKIEEGSLLTLDNLIDTTTGTVKGRGSFANKNVQLYPNQFVNTRLLVDTLHNATLIPDSTIQHNGPVAFVYVIQNGVAHERQITPGVTDDGVTSVQGINPGDVVANSSFDKLEDNSKIVLSNKPVPVSASGSDAP